MLLMKGNKQDGPPVKLLFVLVCTPVLHVFLKLFFLFLFCFAQAVSRTKKQKNSLDKS